MPIPVIYMDPLSKNEGVIYMDPLPPSEGIIYMTPIDEPTEWVFIDIVTFPAVGIVNTTTFNPGYYGNCYGSRTYQGYDSVRIVYNDGAIYRGVALNDYRTAVAFITQIATGACADAPASSTNAAAIAAARGSSLELSLGNDSVMAFGAYLAGPPGDTNGHVSFFIYGSKSK